MSARRSLVLLDGHSLAYRAFYALPDSLRTQSGALTNAVFGFTSMLIKLLADRDPDAIAVAFDMGRDVERTAAFPAYKANRAATPDDFKPQIDMIKQVLETLQIPTIEVAGVEADDVLATVADRAVAEGYHVFIVTGDRDAMQLVSDELTVLYTLRGISEVAEMTPIAVEERFGVPPSSYLTLAALRGDTSDNLPGVPGVGDKTAAKLVREFGDIDGIYAHIDEIGGTKVPRMLVEHESQVRTNARLMRLRRDVEVDASPEALTRAGIDASAVRELFMTLEFRTLYERLITDVLESDDAADVEALHSRPQLLDSVSLASWLRAAGSPVTVLAASAGRPPDVQWTSVGLAAPDCQPAAVLLDALDQDASTALEDLLADPATTKTTHDLKALHHAVATRGWSLAGVVLDTQLAAYLISPEQRAFDLDRLALQHLARTIRPESAPDDTAQLALTVDADAWKEQALRAEAARLLAETLGTQLDERGQRALLDNIEMPLAGVLARMEHAGIAVDRTVLEDLRSRIVGRVEKLEADIRTYAGRAFNIASGPQLQQVLFDELDLPRTRKIKTGYSTDAQALSGLRGRHPIIEAILEWRELTKLITTYIDALPPLIDASTGRIHTTLSQTIAATGRLASSQPNMQNIPVRRPEGREIRRAFVPGSGFDILLVADYSQIELRILAHLSADDGLLSAFAAGEDIHATTAAKIFDMPLDAVDSTLRDRAKAVNYGLAYGLTSYGLAQQLGIPPDEAQEIVDAYFDRFPGVRAFLEDAVTAATRDGYTTTMFGRRRYLPDLRSDDRQRRQMAERMALNAPIQGTAADIIKLAMIALQRAIDDASLRTQLLLQVHDEVILEVPDDERDAARDLVVDALSGVADLAVPLDVDTAFGTTWFDAQKH
ncbi:MAG: DNA polymerase I [Nitriliruptoraceae bacterium]